MNNANLQLAHAIAERLVRANTDHNELSKASAYLNQTRDAKAFFTWLDWMATPRVSEKLARSRQTPEYYRQIRDACQSLRQIDKVEEMAQILGWAVRLMRYMPYARPISAQELDASLAGKQSASPFAPRAEDSATPPRTRLNISDLRPGMQLNGTVKRTTNFGAFVDVGVGSDGLVHISKLKQGYVSSVADVVKDGQQVMVWVESVEPGQRKIGLTMIPPKGGALPVEAARKPQPKSVLPATEPQSTTPRPLAVRLSAGDKPESGKLVIGKIVRIEPSRLVVDIGLSEPGSLTFDRMPGKPSREDIEDRYEDGQQIAVWIQGVNKQGRVQLTLLIP